VPYFLTSMEFLWWSQNIKTKSTNAGIVSVYTRKSIGFHGDYI